MKIDAKPKLDWSWYPFEFKYFVLKIEEIDKNTAFLRLGIHPVIMTLSMDNQYITTFELRIWKLSLTFSISWS
tara:strand:- start:1304 stop:1522 length:219 start_codon:yes stop_codon:yes gene_type:complete